MLLMHLILSLCRERQRGEGGEGGREVGRYGRLEGETEGGRERGREGEGGREGGRDKGGGGGGGGGEKLLLRTQLNTDAIYKDCKATFAIHGSSLGVLFDPGEMNTEKVHVPVINYNHNPEFVIMVTPLKGWAVYPIVIRPCFIGKSPCHTKCL